MKAAVESRILLRGGSGYPWLWEVAFFERDLDGALRILGEWEADEDYTSDYSSAWAYGKTYKFLSDTPELAEPYFQQFRIEQENQPPPAAPYPVAADLAEVYGYLGDPERALELCPSSDTGLYQIALGSRLAGQELHWMVIWALMASGDHAAAIEQIDAYLQAPMMLPIEGLQLDPRLDPVRDHPDFLALVEKYRRP